MAALKRLISDLKELTEKPIPGVSATPLEDNFFEWHCNFMGPPGSGWDTTPFHVILFFPDTYPTSSPKAEFMPKGFQPVGGVATKDGKKGTAICLSIFSDFENYHAEWKTEKGTGWSSAYTVGTALLNLVSFFAEQSSNYNSASWKYNVKISEMFECKDCGHTKSAPFPEITPFTSSTTTAPATQSNVNASKEEIEELKKADETKAILTFIKENFTCYVTKQNPIGDPNEIYGLGVAVTGNERNPQYTSPCEILTYTGFQQLAKTRLESVLREEFHFFLPLYLNFDHAKNMKSIFEASCKSILNKPKFDPTDVLLVLPKLLNSTVVAFMNGSKHTSERALHGYFLFHRLFLWAVATYPELSETLNLQVNKFVEKEYSRDKKFTPNIGEWLTFLLVANKHSWADAANAYLNENFLRNVMWYLKDFPGLQHSSVKPKERLETTFKATKISRDLLAFQVSFLEIAKPPNMAIADICTRYDQLYGMPTKEMEEKLKEHVKKITQLANYEEWFQWIDVKPPDDDDMAKWLWDSVVAASTKQGYFFDQKKGGGGSGGKRPYYKK